MTERRLGDRAKEHLPAWLLNGTEGNSSSSITDHIHGQKHTCKADDCFKILYRARNRAILRFVEAVAIKRAKPGLNVMKETDLRLQLPWSWTTLRFANPFSLFTPLHYSLSISHMFPLLWAPSAIYAHCTLIHLFWTIDLVTLHILLEQLFTLTFYWILDWIWPCFSYSPVFCLTDHINVWTLTSTFEIHCIGSGQFRLQSLSEFVDFVTICINVGAFHNGHQLFHSLPPLHYRSYSRRV